MEKNWGEMEVQKGEYTKCNWARLIGFEVPRESFRNRHLRDYDERKDHKNLFKKKFQKSHIRLMFRFYAILCLKEYLYVINRRHHHYVARKIFIPIRSK